MPLTPAFDDMLKDPEFLDEINKAKAEFKPMSGEKLQELIASAANAPKEVIDKTRAYIQGDK